MGLADRKQKQRIPADPQNLSWADDASRFGLSYLSKFGWDASQGLGASGDGMKTHIKVQHKLDMMGVGAQHQRDPNGIAWKQNKDFEALLKRLNEHVEQEGAIQDDASELEVRIGGRTFVESQEEKVEEKYGDDSSLTTAKKRKHRDDTHPGSDTRKKRKKEKKDRHQKSDSDISSEPAVSSRSSLIQSSSGSHSDSTSKPRPMAHRARIRAAKRIADKSASAISEILGIAPSSSLSTSTPTSTPSSPPSATPDPQRSSLSLDNLTTSAKSVADYFKEKLLARSTTSALPPTPQALSCSTRGLGATRLETGLSSTFPPEEEPPRKGIGSQVPSLPPISQMSGPALVSENGAHDQDMVTEKMRRKAERKAEKRKRREAEASQPVCECSVKQAEPTESIEKTSKEKKKKKLQELNKRAHVDGEGITKKDPKHITLWTPPGLKKK